MDNIIQTDIFDVDEFFCQNACGTILDLFYYSFAQRMPRSLCFQTSFLAAFAYNVIVKDRYVTKLPRKSRFTIVKLPVDHNAQAYPVVDVDKKSILFIGHDAT